MGRSALPGGARNMARLPTTINRPRPRHLRCAAPTTPPDRPEEPPRARACHSRPKVRTSRARRGGPGLAPRRPHRGPLQRRPRRRAQPARTRSSRRPAVAVIGATEKEGSVGRTVFWNLISSPFGGTVYPVNQKRASILGVRAYPNLAALPEVPELVVIATPATTIPATVEECAAAGVKAVVIISAGFKEVGPEGAELERQILETARANGMRIVGPNCLGVMRPPTGLNATFAAGISTPGNGRLRQPERRAPDGRPRLEHPREGRLQRGRLARLDARRRLGRRHHLPRQRPGHPEHRHLHGDDRRRARLPVGRPRGRPHEADHRHQARPDRRRRPRPPPRTRARSPAPTRSSTPRSGAWASSASTRSPTSSTSPRSSPSSRARGASRLTIVTNAGGPGVLATDALITGGGELSEISPATMEELNALPAGAVEPQQPDRHHRRRRARSGTRRRSRSRRATRGATGSS